MKFLIDNNLSYKLINKLNSVSLDAVHVKNVLTVYTLDNHIWEFARENELVIITKDNDFDELSQLYGCPPKVVHLLYGNKSTEYVSNLIISNKISLIQFVKSEPENCLLKISD